MGYLPWSNHSSGVGALTPGEQQSEELELLRMGIVVVWRGVSVPRSSSVRIRKVISWHTIDSLPISSRIPVVV